ncbi:hypothetical protein HY498_03435 [Candidatus Woesearchaeota archaeon]|nr:hypothetical protein [Candidatus Woesearchaeota archaeon]
MKTLESCLIKYPNLIETFCKLYSVDLVNIETTTENNYPEPIFYFSDDSGGYTIKGLEDSIREKILEN